MSLVLCQINQEWMDTAPKDTVVNTLHFADGTPSPLSDTDYGDIASVVGAAFHTFYADASTDGIGGTKRGFTTKVYELDDPSTREAPRRPRATHVIAPTANEAVTGLGPRQIATCLSFYSTANNPRTRGRIYLGPFATHVLDADHVPVDSLHPALTTLVGQFGAAGGDGVEWVTFSTRGAGHASVSHWWMDDRWDVIRKRASQATKRITGTTGG